MRHLPRLILALLLVVSISGCATAPASSSSNKHRATYRINFENNADWFAITLDEKGSDARFVLPDNPGIWIKDAHEQINSVKLSTTTSHIHRAREANRKMVSHNFYIESARPEIIVKVEHGANGRVVIRSDCDAVTTEGPVPQTFKLRLCRQ